MGFTHTGQVSIALIGTIGKTNEKNDHTLARCAILNTLKQRHTGKGTKMDFTNFLVIVFAFFVCTGTVIAFTSKAMKPATTAKILTACKIRHVTNDGAVDCAVFIGWASFFIGFVGLYSVALYVK